MPPSSQQNIDDPISLSVEGVRQLIGSKINKVNRGNRVSGEGPEGDQIDELELPMTDEELLALAVRYEDLYKSYEEKIKTRQEKNKQFYLGRQLEGTAYNVEFPIAGNLLFEALETFLPAALSRNPEPIVWCDNSELGTVLAKDVKTMLQYHADVLVLRRKLAMTVRQWSIYFIGVMKHGFDKELNEIKSEVRHPKNFIFDPNGSVDVYGDFDSWLGERITLTAQELIDENPEQKEYISISVKGKLGTSVTYTEWWSADGSYYFCTYMDRVLDKHKNPNFNYEDNDDKIVNHFAKPKKPYSFLAMFSLGEQPHDITSLIEQNIPNQNLISKRTMQIDLNLSRQNNSVAFSGDNFNQQTAKQASQAFEKGNPVLVPPGRPIAEAIIRFPAEAYPDAAFKELEMNKQNLRSSFGTQGITAEQPNEERTARGMILNQQRDSTRIGGGIGDALEQFADNIFNWWVQLYYVYYDEPHEARILGGMKGMEYATLSTDRFVSRVVVSVGAGTMAPKDEISEKNQAIQLYEMGALDPKTLLTILDVPDLQKTIENVLLWMVNKQAYIAQAAPELAQQMAPQGQPGQPTGEGPQPQGQPTLGGEPASAQLSNIQLPPLSTPAA